MSVVLLPPQGIGRPRSTHVSDSLCTALVSGANLVGAHDVMRVLDGDEAVGAREGGAEGLTALASSAGLLDALNLLRV